MLDFGPDAMELLCAEQSASGLAILAAAAFVEHAFPPFPGDAVTLFGAFLAATARWSAPAVLAAATVGSVAGSAFDYWIGTRLAARPAETLTARQRRLRDKMAHVVPRFERHGALIICANRFFPGIRALFLVAAGYAKMPFGRVMLFALVSAALWNALVIAAGFAVGENFEALRALFSRYAIGAWAITGAAAIALLVRSLWKKKRLAG